ncbi:MAG: VWA domain-containing protein, partial [Planctomycetota bacterium]
PIPARGEVRVTISYQQVLHRSGGFTRLRYPLDTGRFAAGPYQNVRIHVELKSDSPVKSVSSPSHAIDVKRIGPRHLTATFEAATHEAHKDCILDVLTASEGLAGGVRAYSEKGEDGYFLLRLAPGDEPPREVPPVTIIFVVDTSGSMAGQKIDHVRKALNSALDRLRPVDHFQILAFSSRVRSLALAALPATRGNLEEGRRFVEELLARGGTDIGSALEQALTDAGMSADAPTLVLMTDGAPTVGVTDPHQIVRNAVARNGGDYRIHIFGVGHDVNTLLLDDLAGKNGGSRTYLEGTDRLEVSISGLLDKVTLPCLSDLRVSATGVQIDRLEPAGPYDLFFGEDLVIAGRYRGAGTGSIRVEGEVGRIRRGFVFTAEFPAHGGDEEAAYLWAQNRIFTLLDALRGAKPMRREALKREVVNLGLRFGIVTPYTSFLVTEDHSNALSRGIRNRIFRDERAKREVSDAARGFAQKAGEDAFHYSQRQAELRKSQRAGAPIAGLTAAPKASQVEQQLGIIQGGGRAFIPMDGRYIEGSIRGKELPAPDRVLVFGSDDFLSFLRNNPSAARILSRSRSLLFRWQGRIIQVDDRPDEILREAPPAPSDNHKKKRERF